MSKITNTQGELLSKDTQEMIEAGFLTPDLKITSDLSYFLEHLNFMANMKAMVARAKTKNAENKKTVKAEAEDSE